MRHSIKRFSFLKATPIGVVLFFFLLPIFIFANEDSNLSANNRPPLPLYPIPLPRQLQWQKLEQYAFIHFGPNTFRNAEWGEGKPTEGAFFAPTNSSAVYTKQWVDELTKVGMNGIIFTAKHHDGFCLWQTKTTLHSLRNSNYCGGNDDVVRDLSDNAKKAGVNIGIYISPWDRSNWAYLSDDYVKIFREQVREISTNYGDIFEIWFDGANGDKGWYGGGATSNWHKKRGALSLPLLENGDWRENHLYDYYPASNKPKSLFRRVINEKKATDWITINNTVCKNSDDYIQALRQDAKSIFNKLQPNAVIFGEGTGEGVRWVGNEQGWAGRTNWSMGTHLSISSHLSGDENGTFWNPAECDMKTHEGWFYSTKSPLPKDGVNAHKNYIEYYYRSVGRNATLLLNFSPARDGKIPQATLEEAKKFWKTITEDFAHNLVINNISNIDASNIRANSKQFSPLNLIDENFDTYWATDDEITNNAYIILNFKNQVTFDRVVLQEYIPLGQRVKSFKIEYSLDDDGVFFPLEYPNMPHSIAGDSDEPDVTTTIGYKRILRCYETTAKRVKISFIQNRVASPFVISEIALYDSPNSCVKK